jgi:putative PEP-CTERM system histidine kinase
VHDLKNLIAQLSLLVSNAAKHKNNPLFIDDVVRTVENSVARMNRLLIQLRSGSAGTSDPVCADRALIELCALLREVAAAKASRKPIPTVECAEVGMAVLGDRDQLATAIGHIVQNAQEATPPQGTVRLRLESAAGQAIIEVEDSGSGMDASFIQERLFSPFDSTKGRAGMGIGAYESRELIRQMGGDIDVTSRPGEGTTFRIVLPLVTDEAMENGESMRVKAAG